MMRGLAVSLAVAWLGGCDARVPVAIDARIVPRDGGAMAQCAAPGSVMDSRPCACAADCRSGALCVDEAASGVPGGVCVHLCTVGGSGECSAGTTCLDLEGTGGGRGLCEQTCVASTDCPAERVCGDGVCQRFCASDDVCVSGHCDPWTARCAAPDAITMGRATFAACTRSDECRSALCVDGRCASPCALSTGHCPAGEVCLYELDADFDDAGACYARCERDDDCAADLRCGLGARPGVTERVCIPGSRSW